jgi:hypothetical protein
MARFFVEICPQRKIPIQNRFCHYGKKQQTPVIKTKLKEGKKLNYSAQN